VSAVLRIAWREVRERRVLLWAGLGFSLLALLCRVLPGVGGAYGIGELLAILLFAAFPPAVALIVGSSIVGRDLAERRLAFYFCRPLSAWTLCAGKLLGGVTLVAAAFVPCYFAFVLSSAPGHLPGQAFGAAFLVSLCLMTFAHVVTTMYRSGSPLFALDLGLGAMVVILFGVQMWRLTVAGAGPVLFAAAPLALAGATIAMMAAAAAQLVYGRADARRGHRALSATVWTLAPAGLGALALWGGWLLGVTPANAGGAGTPLFAAPHGSTIVFKGSSWHGRAGFSPVFLMNGESGAYVRLPPERVSPPAFAGDGSMAVWVAPAASWWEIFVPQPAQDRGVWVAPAAFGAASVEPWDPQLMWVVARLDRGQPTLQERPLGLRDGAALAVDGDGKRVLISGPSSVLLLETASGGLLASVPLADIVAADFRPDGAVRFYQKEAAGPGRRALVVLDWSLQDGSRVERGRVAGEARLALLARRGDLAVVSTGSHDKAILDAATGAVRTLSHATADFPGAALVLSNGNVATSLGDEVRIMGRDGSTVASLSLEPGTRAHALCEPAAGELAVGVWSLSLSKRHTVFVDAATGTVRREEKELLPVGAGDGRRPAPEPGSLAPRLFTDLDGALIALEADGRRRVVVAAP
jgi:hypothetical protein